MARRLRLEAEDRVYHVINRGNYRVDIFQNERAKTAFLRCLEGACERTGWVVHAWCVMSNHYHIALTTPRPNLAAGMKWLQGTLARRFNRARDERGHLFQGRYKSFVVEREVRLGPLCHYIHLNPVKAGLCTTANLPRYRWTSVSWLHHPARRPKWYDPQPFLQHAGELADRPAGHARYREFLEKVAADESTRQRQGFHRMSRGWAVGTASFIRAFALEHRQRSGRSLRLAAAAQAEQEAEWSECLARGLARIGRQADELRTAGKSASWKLALAVRLKAQTTVTNRWLSTHLHLGALHEVSRKVCAWARKHPPA